MDKNEYDHKMNSIVTDGSYTKLKKDPTPACERKLTKLLKKNKDKEQLTDAQYRKLSQHHSKLPHITAFQLGDDYYQQTEGMAMGSPLSPVIAYIYMENFEELALQTAPLKPSLWLRYVDDTFVLWDHREDIIPFLDHLNSLRLSIQFTMETEVDNKLPFLDVQVEKSEEAFRTSVYRKPTATDRYLNFKSHHPDTVKKGIVRCLQTRATNICGDEAAKKMEMSRLTSTFRRNGYPTSFMKHKPKEASQQQPRNKPITTWNG
ncbi:uncharacterized protein LOC122388745 [Amphibalanus amphitrite]|uniref:uncharacterized protein LOC122388745 n=1 Tax=Amphibalanus amphitrite TaxID=1232801 RepID=UPI001C90EC57|nr:uncharacterized protein LOC122388745 [Amphibalanus amphitrite]